jgi:hypothetical protein
MVPIGEQEVTNCTTRADVHAKNAFEAIVQDIATTEADVKDLPIFITGHGLGGALAQIFAGLLAIQYPEMTARVAGIYTTGQPKVGSEDFVLNMNLTYGEKIFRLVNDQDVIAHLPDVALPGRKFVLPLSNLDEASWEGPGRTVFIGKWGQIIPQEPNTSIPTLTERQISQLPPVVFHPTMPVMNWWKEGTLSSFVHSLIPTAFLDHFPSEYVHRLQMAQVKAPTSRVEGSKIGAAKVVPAAQ